MLAQPGSPAGTAGDERPVPTRRWFQAVVAAMLVSLLMVSGGNLASADVVQNSVSKTAGAVVTMAASGSAQVGFYIQVEGNDGNGGCNASVESPAKVDINVSNATANPSSLTFNRCNEAATQLVTFTSTVIGDHTVTVSVTDSGPGSYSTAPAAFTLRVQPPADATPPVLTPTVTGTTGANGWYTSNATVSWAVSDAQSAATVTSGCAPVSAPDTFTAEGTGFTSSCTAQSAGGVASDSVTVKIDKSGPTASLSASGLTGSNGWFTGDVTVSTNGADSVSGATCTADQYQTTETAGEAFNGSCTNQAGLSTNAAPLTVKLDKTGPTADVAVTAGRLGDNDWYTSDVTVAVQGGDSVSSPVVCSAGQTLSTDTEGVAVGGSCTNDAGLATEAARRTIKVDKSNPTAHLQVAPGATLGTGGWYTSAVTVETHGADNVSGPLACAADQTFETDTAGTAVGGSCTNSAGLTQAAAPIDLRIDTTPPTDVALSVVAGTRGENGWYTSAVTVRATGADATSGVSCEADQVFSADTKGIIVTGSCTNGAGLTTLADPLPLKIDTTAPSANLAVTAGTEGAGGWYTSDVTVSTTGSDSVSDPVTCVGPQHQTTETAATEFNGSCKNEAGVTAFAAPLVVKLDKSGPSALLSPSGPEGANDWFIGDVGVTTSGDDDVSSPVACTDAQDQRDETAGTEFSGYCTNAAGLRTNADPIVVKLDRTPPTAALSPAGTSGANGWFIGDVTVVTDGTDTVSGPVTCTADQHQTAETRGTTFHGSCTNKAGLSIDADPIVVKLDKTAPSGVALTLTGDQGTNGWFTGDVTVATGGNEDISTPLTCDGQRTLVDDTAGTPVHGSCTNDAGLSADAVPQTVKIDKTDPSAHLEIAPGAILGDNDWYVTDVTVRTLGSDNVSEPVACTGDQILDSETDGTTVDGSCTNDAGRRQDAEPIAVKIDKTPPTGVEMSVVAGTPGANGWYTSAVTVRTTGTDVISGVACSSDREYGADTGALVVTGSCTNGAGLTTEAAPLTLKIDTTAPSANLAVTAGTEGDNNWYVSDVTIDTSGDDPTSGVTCTGDQYQTAETHSATFTGKCTNGAGLSTHAAPLTVKLDKTGPSARLSVTAGTLGLNEWYRSDVTLSTSGIDTVSGPVICTGDQRLANDTDAGGQVFAGSCTNDAGLSTAAAPLTVKLDRFAPDVTVGGVTNGPYTLGSVPAASCSSEDRNPGSGLATWATVDIDTSLVTTNKVGTYTATCSGATDRAGNVTSPVSVTYAVIYGTGSGILQPINPDNSSMFSRGKAIPVKFRLPGDESSGGFATSEWKLARVPMSCTMFDTAIGTPEEVGSVTSTTGFRYDASADQYISNADFRDKSVGTCWKMKVTLDDGTPLYSAIFKLQR